MANNDEKGLIPKYVLNDIANAIRSKLKGKNKYKPGAMAEAIKSISSTYFDDNDEFYILSPEYWTIKIDNTLEHQAISYTTSARTDTKNMPDVYYAPKLVILPSIKANAGYTPGIINKTIDYDNHIITFSAGSPQIISDMVSDGRLLCYFKSDKSNTLYKTMTVTHNDSTNSDTYSFSDSIDPSTIDMAIYVVGTDSDYWTEGLASNFYSENQSYINVTGFEADCVTKWWPSERWSQVFFSATSSWKMKYFKMPNLVQFESAGGLLTNQPVLTTVDFHNLEYVNKEIFPANNSFSCVFCTNNSALTDIDFSNLKIAYCEFLTNCKVEEINLPKLETITKLISLPNTTTINAPLLNTAVSDLLCNCPKITNISLPELTSVGGNFLRTVNLLETVDCPKLTTIGGASLNANIQSLHSVNFPELVTAEGNFLNNISSSYFIEVSLPKLKTAGHYFLYADTALQKASLPELTTVAQGICSDCPAITDVYAPKLQSVGDKSFSNDKSLVTLSLPELTNANTICTDDLSLHDISLPKLTTINTDFLMNDASIETIECPALTSIGNNCLDSNCEKLKSINFPELVKVGRSFINNQSSSNFTKVSLPKLQSAAWLLCSVPKLQIAEFPELLTIGNNFCAGCDSLTEISVPKLQTVGGDAFTNNYKLTNISFPELTSVGGAFITNDTLIETVDCPKLSSIGGNGFINCPKITDISLPKLVSIGGKFFANDNDSYLENIDVPMLETVNGRAFDRNNAIKILILPKLKKVTEDFCDRMSNLVYIDFGALESVNGNYIWNCPAIKTLIIRSSVVPSIGKSICNQKPSDCILYVPDNMISKYLADSKWSAVFDSDHIKPIADAPAAPTTT